MLVDDKEIVHFPQEKFNQAHPQIGCPPKIAPGKLSRKCRAKVHDFYGKSYSPITFNHFVVGIRNLYNPSCTRGYARE
jgi:hypothetical protein